MPRSAIPLTFDIRLPAGPGSPSSRLAAELVRAMASGRLRDGDPLPSSRSLAMGAGVARSTVVAAYDELSVVGYVTPIPGSMTVVADGAHAAARTSALLVVEPDPSASETDTAPISRPRYDLAPGYPDVGLINARAWDSAWRRAHQRARLSTPYSLHLRGNVRYGLHEHLRQQLADHLRRNRGIVCDADDIFVYPSIGEALMATVEVLALGSGPVAFEDPGAIVQRRALTAVGCTVRPYPVDRYGLTDDILGSSESLLVATPAHQHPTGAVMPLERRTALLRWAERTGAVIVEDDHDGQFRQQATPVPPLRALPTGDEHVVHIGTGYRLLTTDLQIAWAVVPHRLRSRFDEYRMNHGNAVCPVSASAFAEFIATGSLTRHLARSGRTYRARLDAFLTACRTLLPDLEVMGADAGLHVTLLLPPGTDDASIVAELHRRGIECLTLSGFYDPQSDTPRRPGLVCGYARLPETLAAHAVRVIADTLR